jgi:DNA repair photolyase
MEEKLSIKTNAVELLEKQLALRARKGQYGIIVLSSATDPYLSFEKEYQLTRKILEVILHYQFPVHIITKSNLVVRDFDLIREIEKNAILPADLAGALSQKSFITFSFSTVDDALAKIFEPGATPPSQRLEALQKARDAGLMSGISLMPLIPYITDTAEHLEKMFGTFKKSGAKYIFPASITLFGNQAGDSKTMMLRAIQNHFPQLMDTYHRFFDQANSMPSYYQQAFAKKMEELIFAYGFSNRLY